jgi:hypothetical protein
MTCFVEYQGQIEQWIDFSTLEIDVNIGKWLGPRFGSGVYNAEVGDFTLC